MTVSVVFAIAGVIALLVGIVGGGIKAKEIEVPLIPNKVRVVTILVGVALIGATVWLEVAKMAARPPASTGQTPAASPGFEPQNPPAAVSVPSPASAQGSGTDPDATDLFSVLAEAKTWDLVLHERFDNNDRGWTLWNVDDAEKTESMRIEDGVLRWGVRLKEPDNWYWEIAPVGSTSDFYASVKARRTGKPAADQVTQAIWGLVFRREGGDFYAFLLNDLGEYWLSLHGDDGWTELVGNTKSSLVDLDQSNELAVVADGPEITLFINGTPVKSLSDGALSEGNVGFYAGLLHENDDVQFEFDDFELRQKP